MDYRLAGVDIDAADALIERIRPMVKTTNRLGALGMIGGFGALFDPKAAGFNDPIMVTSTDGVGTKLRIAIEVGLHSTIGIDLVAMCVNDLLAQGAEPLSFLDYFATGKLDLDVAASVISGIVKGCQEAGCVLAGGETAEMPGMYPEGEYDLAGFALGAVERGNLLPASVTPGDLLIGLASSGIHSNGFSLVRKIVAAQGLSWTAPAPFSERGLSLAKEFLTPTKIYVRPILAMHKKGLLHAAAHITGGGLIGNLPRVLPEGTRAVFSEPWAIPKVFGWLRRMGNISIEEMCRTFNCGVGMVMVCPPTAIENTFQISLNAGIRPVILGKVAEGNVHEISLPSDKWWQT